MALVVIAQARMGSTRLPGKVLMPLGGEPALSQVIRRLKKIRNADRICIATSDMARDDPIEDAANALRVTVFRGSEKDVLRRYAAAAAVLGADTVVRVTCDCPLIDPELCDELIDLYRRERCDYACISADQGWPQGLDCEVFSGSLLAEADKGATDPYDREHVTSWMYRDGAHAKKMALPAPESAPSGARWVLDTSEDYLFLEALFARLSQDSEAFSWQKVQDVIGEAGLSAPRQATHRQQHDR